MRIPALDRKLLRDIWRIRGQALAVAAVIGAGVGMYVLMLSTFDSLELTQRAYYDRFRFGDVFASCTRAPSRLGERIADIPGVAQAETRVVADVTLDVPGLSEPVTGRLISIPAVRRAVLCDLYLREGRWIEPGRPDEVILSADFAGAHGLQPGDTIAALINGRRQTLRIVGLALSPEFVYPIRPGELLPDEARFGVIWMERRALAAAFDMEGGFNDVVLTVMRGASTPDVIGRLDRLLAPYGGRGAIPRALQVSNWYLDSELKQLRNMGRVIPIVFLAVAAFLVNVVLSRTVTVQREQIAAIKALGYSNSAVALHYIKWSLIVAAVGSALGVVLGVWTGSGMTRMYTSFFHFPILLYRLEPKIVAVAVAISVLAAALGAVFAVRRAVMLPPAEAMRPLAPAHYTVSVVERIGLGRWLSQPARMIARTMQRHPGRAALSVIGIGLGGSLLVVGSFSLDSMDVMMDLQFDQAQRYDVMVTFNQPASASALQEVERFPGVISAEPFRAVPVRLRNGFRSRQTAITGVVRGATLNRVVDASFRVVEMPPEGLVLSRKLAEILQLRSGDTVTVEVLEGARPVREVPVTATVSEFMGTNAYMDLAALHRLMHEGGTLSGAYLEVDGDAVDELYSALKQTPRVAGVMRKRAALESFKATIAEMMGSVRAVNVLFALIIAFGVVYNSARISLSERNHELATLRVLGFSRGEVAYILLGELAVVTLLAVPVGLWAGHAIAAWMVTLFDTEVWRMPLVISPRTYAFAAVTIVVATVVSGWIVRRKLNRLDMVEALKTRE